MPIAEAIAVLDVSSLPYPERLCAASLQGLANRGGARVFIDYGVYDDPASRRTNEVFIDDARWFGKFRSMLGNQDLRNLEYYEAAHGITKRQAPSLDALIADNAAIVTGYALWDEAFPDTANVAVMLAARDGVLPIVAGMEARMRSLGLSAVHDLRGKWKTRVALYRWAYGELFAGCAPGKIACIEPAWNRPEFIDYIVQNKIFTYNLASGTGAGEKLLMLLAFGPALLRELLFALRLDKPLRRLGLAIMGARSPETRLATRIQRAVLARPYPTIFGWHTSRDDELAFMLQLSANGLRLVPSHLAGNFSFHGLMEPRGAAPQPAGATRPEGDSRSAPGMRHRIPEPAEATLDPEGVYVTFTLSDGDQLMMMSTGQLGNWYSPLRGTIPFNWETQPLLVELAPALLERFRLEATDLDCLIAGPSGAGYVVPPLCPDLAGYMDETARVCEAAGIRVVTSYVADPPMRVLRTIAKHRGGIRGFLCGYAVVERAPQTTVGGCVFIANEIPLVSGIADDPAKLFERLEELIDAPGTKPRFIAVHLFAYRTSLDDVARFIAERKDAGIHFVGAVDFLTIAELYFSKIGK